MFSITDTFLNKHIGRYDIRDRIGTGGMARVFKGWDTNLERVVAIKILHEHLTDDPTFNERFEREARLVASLNHPNIVQIYDYSVLNDDGQLISYMVMPFISGRTLKEILEEFAARSERIERSRILAIMLNLTAALGYAHARGMIHRDVKPGNIMFDEHGQAILTDFGIARLKETTQLTQEGATVGTPIYISPEQAVGKPVDMRTDLYSLGVILYEMLAGVPPYNDENSVSIILKHLNAPIPSISEHISVNDPELDSVIFRALAKNPDHRYQTAQEFADDLTRVLSKPAASPALHAQTMPKLEISYTQPLPIAPANGASATSSNPSQTIATGSSRSLLNILAVVVAIAALVIALALIFALRSPPPSAAPDTQISSMTGNEDHYFISSFSTDDPNNKGWPQTTEGSNLRQITADGFYHFQNQLPNTVATSIFTPDDSYEDATITLEGTLDSSSPSESGYGIVFRHIDDLNYNVFAVDGRGRFSIWSLTNGTWKELRGAAENWTPNKFINSIGQKNQLTVTFVGDHLVGSVNQQVVADVHVETGSVRAGAIGMYLGTPDSGGAGMLVDTYEITGNVPSMTGQGS